MVKERYLINEAAKEVHVESHVLRYWEEELELPIGRNEQGHRIYTQEDIDRFINIKNLKDQGLQLKAVKTLLAQVHDDGGEEDMRADNPFAQKQLTKIAKLGEVKPVTSKDPEEMKWSERFAVRKKDAPEEVHTQEAAAQASGSMKNMIEIKEVRAVDEPRKDAGSGQLQAAPKEQTMRLQYLFQKLIKEAVAANNEEMAERLVERITENVKGDICKELDYQFRLMEERDEESRKAFEDRRNEEYYKRIDELLRQYSTRNSKPKASRSLFKRHERPEKEEGQQKEEKDNTVRFEEAKERSSKEEGTEQEKADKKQKREFHFLRRTAEVK